MRPSRVRGLVPGPTARERGLGSGFPHFQTFLSTTPRQKIPLESERFIQAHACKQTHRVSLATDPAPPQERGHVAPSESGLGVAGTPR